MGYKILDVKADIHEDVEAYFNRYWPHVEKEDEWKQVLQEDILDIVDKHFEKIER
tara:strand:- start:223 stop:387 length:165 start_codon:yes stop_codon:yes gene_type:complete